MSNDPTIDDETWVTEITLQPDGRVYVFGASRDVLSLLAELQPNDAHLLRLLAASSGDGPSEIPPL